MPLSFPGVQNTFFVWLGKLLWSIAVSAAYFFLNSLFFSLFATICEFHKAFYLNFEFILSKLNQEINNKEIKYNKIQLTLIELMQNSIKGKE